MASDTQGVTISVVTAQPGNVQDGRVTVRTLQNTLEDTDFAGRLTVDGFINKFQHAVSKNSIEKCYRLVAKVHRDQPESFYQRIFIAEYEGKRAGVLALKLRGDPEASFEWGDLAEFGCCDIIGLSCLAASTSVLVPTGECYLDHICVDEGFRGRGIGKVLMVTVEQEARRQNCSEIILDVKTTNRARHLYERQGYVIVDDSGCCLSCCMWCTMGVKRFYKMRKQL